MGVVALLQIFLPVFPEVLPTIAAPLAWLAVATVLVGAFAALAQRDLKRMLAYSSVNHLGYCVLGLVAIGGSGADRPAMLSAATGTALQLINHGVIATALFLGMTVLEHRSGGRRRIDDFGGLRSRMPVFCGCFGVAVFASLGLPGLSGFIGEFLIFNGAFASMPVAAACCVLGLLFTAVFLLRMMRSVFWGPLRHSCAAWADLSNAERALFAVLMLLILVPGIWPQALLHHLNPVILERIDPLHPKS
jgi:NADH-quinone oxidoreductase subunit M